jgi:hypothetical protein
MRRGRLILCAMQAALLTLGVLAASAIACEGASEEKSESTSLSTKLSGESKEGEEITALEGSKVKDKATLGGRNASKATGKVTYKIYSDKECKTLKASAGEVTVSGESVPASSEEELEGGKTYYWQAHYGGDSKNAESTSPCTEVLKVKAKTTLSTKLFGEGKEGTELTVLEGEKVKDKATVEGTNSSSAEGKVFYKVYSDSKCEAEVGRAGEENVSGGSGAASEEKELTGGKTYYWQATYKGDSLHQESTSECGKEVATVKGSTSLATSLSGEGQLSEEVGIVEGAAVSDTATLSGVAASMATGTVKYDVYSDAACEELVAGAGEVSITGGFASASTEETFPAGIYYWQATYSGDGFNQGSKGVCGSEVEFVTPHVTNSLSGEEESGEEINVEEGAAVKDTAALHGEHASTATGTVKYKIYSDSECKDLVAEAGEVTVTSGSVPASSEETLPAGTYYWQAIYSGDSNNPAATSPCDSGVAVVTEPLTGEEGSYEAEETQIPAGQYSANADSFVFGGGLNNPKVVSCRPASFRWGAQAPGNMFVVTPSYRNCLFNNVVANVTVGAACNYQFNPPFGTSGPDFRASVSITGMGCELILTLENRCEVKIKNEPHNENILLATLTNVRGGANILLDAWVLYTSRRLGLLPWSGCGAPVETNRVVAIVAPIVVPGLVVGL